MKPALLGLKLASFDASNLDGRDAVGAGVGGLLGHALGGELGFIGHDKKMRDIEKEWEPIISRATYPGREAHHEVDKARKAMNIDWRQQGPRLSPLQMDELLKPYIQKRDGILKGMRPALQELDELRRAKIQNVWKGTNLKSLLGAIAGAGAGALAVPAADRQFLRDDKSVSDLFKSAHMKPSQFGLLLALGANHEKHATAAEVAKGLRVHDLEKEKVNPLLSGIAGLFGPLGAGIHGLAGGDVGTGLGQGIASAAGGMTGLSMADGMSVGSKLRRSTLGSVIGASLAGVLSNMGKQNEINALTAPKMATAAFLKSKHGPQDLITRLLDLAKGAVKQREPASRIFNSTLDDVPYRQFSSADIVKQPPPTRYGGGMPRMLPSGGKPLNMDYFLHNLRGAKDSVGGVAHTPGADQLVEEAARAAKTHAKLLGKKIASMLAKAPQGGARRIALELLGKDPGFADDFAQGFKFQGATPKGEAADVLRKQFKGSDAEWSGVNSEMNSPFMNKLLTAIGAGGNAAATGATDAATDNNDIDWKDYLYNTVAGGAFGRASMPAAALGAKGMRGLIDKAMMRDPAKFLQNTRVSGGLRDAGIGLGGAAGYLAMLGAGSSPLAFSNDTNEAMKSLKPKIASSMPVIDGEFTNLGPQKMLPAPKTLVPAAKGLAKMPFRFGGGLGKTLGMLGTGLLGGFIGNRSGQNTGRQQGLQQGFGQGLTSARQAVGDQGFFSRMFKPTGAIDQMLAQLRAGSPA